jgi:transposase
VGRDWRDQGIAELERRLAERDKVIAQLRAELQAARAEIADLKARLGTSSRNSSKPPSTDPPGASRPAKPPTRRKPGGQPGHPRHERRRLPKDRKVHLVPEACERFGAPLADEPLGVGTHQVVDRGGLGGEIGQELLVLETACSSGGAALGTGPCRAPRSSTA